MTDNARLLARDTPPTVVRLRPEIRDQLVRIATTHRRSLSKEIAMRLEDSLALESRVSTADAGRDAWPAAPAQAALIAAEPGMERVTHVEMALLDVFRRMPVEKQLALLSLFK